MQAAGSQRVLEVHGSASRERCLRAGHPMAIGETHCPVQGCNALPRPDCMPFFRRNFSLLAAVRDIFNPTQQAYSLVRLCRQACSVMPWRQLRH